jgi:hypothetical protein
MPRWKQLIFVRAIEIRVAGGEGTEDEIIDSYTKLTDAEKADILTAVKA